MFKSIFNALNPIKSTPSPKKAKIRANYKTVHPSDIEAVMLVNPNLTTGPWVAGGAILHWYNNTPVGFSDIDVFCKDNQQATTLISKLKGTEDVVVCFESDNATTFRYNNYQRIQIITREFFATPQDVIDRFDISVCRLLTDGYTFMLGEHTAHDIRTKTLRMKLPIREEGVKRYIKYLAYGYRPVDGLHQEIVNSAPASFDIADFVSEGSDYRGL